MQILSLLDYCLHLTSFDTLFLKVLIALDKTETGEGGFYAISGLHQERRAHLAFILKAREYNQADMLLRITICESGPHIFK